jgi:hypothetical protein
MHAVICYVAAVHRLEGAGAHVQRHATNSYASIGQSSKQMWSEM